jgi:hypothetical protein
LRAAPASGLAIEIWDVDDLLARMRVAFGHAITDISRASLPDVRTAIEQAQWRLAFDGKFPDDPRAGTLLWHLSPWEFGRLYREGNLAPDGITRAGDTYEEAVVVMADMC